MIWLALAQAGVYATPDGLHVVGRGTHRLLVDGEDRPSTGPRPQAFTGTFWSPTIDGETYPIQQAGGFGPTQLLPVGPKRVLLQGGARTRARVLDAQGRPSDTVVTFPARAERWWPCGDRLYAEAWQLQWTGELKAAPAPDASGGFVCQDGVPEAIQLTGYCVEGAETRCGNGVIRGTAVVVENEVPVDLWVRRGDHDPVWTTRDGAVLPVPGDWDAIEVVRQGGDTVAVSEAGYVYLHANGHLVGTLPVAPKRSEPDPPPWRPGTPPARVTERYGTQITSAMPEHTTDGVTTTREVRNGQLQAVLVSGPCTHLFKTSCAKSVAWGRFVELPPGSTPGLRPLVDLCHRDVRIPPLQSTGPIRVNIDGVLTSEPFETSPSEWTVLTDLPLVYPRDQQVTVTVDRQVDGGWRRSTAVKVYPRCRDSAE